MNLEVLDRYEPYLDKRHTSVSLALRSLLDRPAPVVVELGTSRSFVGADHPGVMENDPGHWNLDEPEGWDWGAGIFSRVCGEVIAGTDATLYSVDPADSAIDIALTIVADLDARVELHKMTSTEFLSSFEGRFDLLYMDHHETCREGAKLHLTDAKVVVERQLLADDGVIVIDDVNVHHPIVDRMIGAGNRLAGHPDRHRGKGAYSIPYFVEHGYEVGYEGYQVVLYGPAVL